MAKIKPMALIESMTGKLCQDSDVSFCRRNGKIYTAKRCHPYTGEPSAAQVAQKEKFKVVTAQVKAIMKGGAGNDQYDEYSADFKNQQKYATLRGYIFAQLWKKG